MSANKVTVAMLKAAGFKIAAGDCYFIGGEKVVLDKNSASTLNSNRIASLVDCDREINHLSPRLNTGDQPVADNCVVKVTMRFGDIRICKACDLQWFNGKEIPFSSDIITWIPHLPTILEQQMNIDKSALELTERDIEDAFIQQDDAAVERVLSESDDWKYNDDVVFDIDCTGVFIGLVPEDNDKAIIYQPDFNRTHIVKVWDLSAPLTPEQLAAKEREDSVKVMFIDAGYSVDLWVANPDDAISVRVDGIISSMYALYDAGYHK